MSNTPVSPDAGTTRFQPSVIIFVVMLLALGVLILAAGNMDPRSLSSAQQRYTFWRSNDGHVTLERPADWFPANVQQPFVYPFLVNTELSNTPQINFVIQAGRLDKLPLQLPAGIKTPKEILSNLAEQNQLGIKRENIRAINFNGLSGYATHIILAPTSQNPRSLDGEIFVVNIDSDHLLLITFATESPDWPRYQPLVERTVQTIQVDGDFARVLDLPPVTPTAEATAQATAAR